MCYLQCFYSILYKIAPFHSQLYTHSVQIIPLPVHVSLLLGTGGDRGIDVYGLTIENNKRTYGHIKYWTKCYRHTLSVS